MAPTATQGRITPIPGFPGEEAAASTIDIGTEIARRFGLRVTDAFDRTGKKHASAGHLVTGMAWDFAGPDAAMDKAARFLADAGYTVGYDGRWGTQAWPGHGPSTVAGSNAHIHVDFSTGPGPGQLPKGNRPSPTNPFGLGPDDFGTEGASDPLGLNAAKDTVTSAIDFASDPVGWVAGQGARPFLFIALVLGGLAVAGLGVARMVGARAPVPGGSS